MTSAPFALVGVAAAVGLVGLFVRFERRGRTDLTFAVVLTVLLVEMVTNASEAAVPRGIFRLPAGELGDLRPPDLVLPLAVAARVLAGGLPSRLTGAAALWTAFLAWYAVAGVTGILRGNDTQEVIFQARSILYIGGAYIVASGVAPERLVTPRATKIAVWTLSPVAAILLASFSLNVDAQLAMLMIAAVVLVVEATRARRRMVVVIPALVMMAGAFAATQAASLAALAVVVGSLAVASLTSTWARRMRSTPTGIAIFVAAVTFALVPVFAAAGDVATERVAEVPTALFSDTQERTTGNRLDLWSDAADVIRSHPVLGAGLGVQHVLPKPWPQESVRVGAHNAALDVGARTGLVGLALFAAAIVASVRSARKVWREHHDDRVAALALGALIALAGFFARAMVEPSLEKFRHAVLFGLVLGVIAATRRSLDARRAETAVAETSF